MASKTITLDIPKDLFKRKVKLGLVDIKEYEQKLHELHELESVLKRATSAERDLKSGHVIRADSSAKALRVYKKRYGKKG